jgi:hypothetical protein
LGKPTSTPTMTYPRRLLFTDVKEGVIVPVSFPLSSQFFITPSRKYADRLTRRPSSTN